eukprot:scaffold17877_cov31-Tisochrysis_lutea.AAC.3
MHRLALVSAASTRSEADQNACKGGRWRGVGGLRKWGEEEAEKERAHARGGCSRLSVQVHIGLRYSTPSGPSTEYTRA